VDNSSPMPGTSTRKPTPAEARRAAKNERKRAGAEAARRAAAARKRRNAGLGAALGVIAIVGVIVAITTLGGTPAKTPLASTANNSASAVPPSSQPTSGPQAPSEAPTPAAFAPNVPDGESKKLKTKPVVKAGTGTVSKLQVTTLVKGTGPVVKKDDTIRVDYVGVTYKDGAEFDSSWKDGQDFTTQIGASKVIPGWDQGLVGVKVGSRVQLDIPVALAYGTPTPAGAPAGDLRFVVDILAIVPAS
jgi:peptidylprolyl isomerase